MISLGYNYRMTHLQAALGISQLRKLDSFVARRREIVGTYNEAFKDLLLRSVCMPAGDRLAAYHIYVVEFETEKLSMGTHDISEALKAEGISTQVHYKPVYLHPYYQDLGYRQGLCPVAEAAWERILTLPLFPCMADEDVKNVVDAVYKVLEAYRK